MSPFNFDYSKRDCSLPPGCKDLIDVIQLGEKAKWKTFFDSYRKLTYDIVRKAGLTDGEAQEVVQDVFNAAEERTRNLAFHPTEGSFKGWVIRQANVPWKCTVVSVRFPRSNELIPVRNTFPFSRQRQ